MKPPSRRRTALALSLALTAASDRPGGAQVVPPPAKSAAAPDCPATSLLEGLRPTLAQEIDPIDRDSALLTDGRVAPEGGAWNSALSLQMHPATTTATFDLGASRTVRALLVQADANDTYLIESSSDGIGFDRLGEIPRLDGHHGLRSRALRTAPATLRYLRIRSSSGDGRAAISEIQAFCTEPGEWQPRLQTIDGPVSLQARKAGWRWSDSSSRWWELTLSCLGLALLLWERHRRRSGRLREDAGPAKASPGANALFACVGLLSVFTYFNFGAFHFGSFVHGWDTFHYYLGAKYFRELSYDRIYDCATVADATREADESDASFAERRTHAESRKIRNLRTNVLESTTDLLAHPESCTVHFSPERWQSFRHDVAWFRHRESASRWDEIFGDHGFNATPVWNIAGTLLANTGPASDRQIGWLALLDPLYFAAMAAVLLWAFGIPGAAVGLLVLATQFPARFFWTGGAFLRWDWLFFTVAAVACLRRGRPFLGGMAFAYAALLRIFPLFLAAGPAAMLIAGLVRAFRRGEGGVGSRLRAALASETLRPPRRFLAGACVAAALLLPASLAVTGGPETYRQFVANTLKHQRTPLTNHMGLRTVVSYRPAEIGRRLHSESAPEPWARWKAVRLAAWDRSRGVAAALALAALALVVLGSVRQGELWVGAALGVAFIPFAVELTSYYYAFLIVPALLWTARREAGIALVLLGAAGLFVSLAPFAGMPTWRDEQYTLVALLTLGTLAFLLVRFAFGRTLFRPRSRAV